MGRAILGSGMGMPSMVRVVAVSEAYLNTPRARTLVTTPMFSASLRCDVCESMNLPMWKFTNTKANIRKTYTGSPHA